MWFNYLLSWHVVTMKDGVLTINRAKLTSQMGFGEGTPAATHLHKKQLEKKNRNALLPSQFNWFLYIK